MCTVLESVYCFKEPDLTHHPVPYNKFNIYINKNKFSTGYIEGWKRVF
jgi:hypothetical protein